MLRKSLEVWRVLPDDEPFTATDIKELLPHRSIESIRSCLLALWNHHDVARRQPKRGESLWLKLAPGSLLRLEAERSPSLRELCEEASQ